MASRGHHADIGGIAQDEVIHGSESAREEAILREELARRGVEPAAEALSAMSVHKLAALKKGFFEADEDGSGALDLEEFVTAFRDHFPDLGGRSSSTCS